MKWRIYGQDRSRTLKLESHCVTWENKEPATKELLENQTMFFLHLLSPFLPLWLSFILLCPRCTNWKKATQELLINLSFPWRGFSGGSDGKEYACNADLIPGLEDPLEGYPLQYSCLENSMDKGAWQATVHGVINELDATEWLTLSLFLERN